MNTQGMLQRRKFLAQGFAAGLSSLLFLPSAVQARAFGWQVVRVGGKDYLKGSDIQRYFKFSDYRRSGKDATWRLGRLIMRARVNSVALRVNDVLFNLTDTVRAHGNKDVLISRLDFSKLLNPVLRPEFNASGPIFDTVVLDPGHGGKDGGAAANGVQEARLALQLASHLGGELQAMGFKVVYTRRDNRFLGLNERVRIANRHPGAIFLCLHYNSARNTSARGIETFALSPQGVAHYGRGLKRSDGQRRSGNVRDSENIALATAVHGALRRGTDAPDRGIKRARWTVLSGLNIPGILLEGGFVSNRADASLLRNPNYIRRQARAIARGVLNYRRAMSNRRR